MQIEIKTAETKPIRNTFAHLAKRFGDKTPTRYQEATYDLQETEGFHYRPLWEADKEIFDPSRTAIVMADWYALKDPRQFYYMTYTVARARQHESVDGQFEYVAERGMLADVPADVRDLALRCLVPLRHYEWGANMNNSVITAWGYGAAMTNAAQFVTMDRLGIAQLLSKVGLLADGNTGTSLVDAKAQWLADPVWQPLREAIEKSFVERDWFKLFVMQDLVFDGLIYPLFYQRFEKHLASRGGAAFGMLLTFQNTWFAETAPWVDAVCKTAAAESKANQELIAKWAAESRATALSALKPIAEVLLGAAGKQALTELDADLGSRLQRIGIPSGEKA